MSQSLDCAERVFTSVDDWKGGTTAKFCMGACSNHLLCQCRSHSRHDSTLFPDTRESIPAIVKQCLDRLKVEVTRFGV